MPRRPASPKDSPPPKTVEFLDGLLADFVAKGRRATAFGEAARWGYVRYVRAELDGGFAVDARTESGCTALINAASGGALAVVRVLLDAGADVNAREPSWGMTPLMANLAALHRPKVHVECCRLLLEGGADPNVRTTDGRTAWTLALDRKDNEALLDLLRSFGAVA